MDRDKIIEIIITVEKWFEPDKNSHHGFIFTG